MFKQTPRQRVLFVRRFTPAALAVIGVFSIFGAVWSTTQTAFATDSTTVNFQARLQTNVGSIVPDGTYNIQFKLYDAASGGTLLWTETYLNANAQGLETRNGYFTTSLGSITPFPTTIDWSQQLYLTMNIGGTAGSGTFPGIGDGEMDPRLPLTASPYAFQAKKAATADSLVKAGSGVSSSLSIQTPTVGNQTFVLQDQGAAGTYNILTAPSGSGVAILRGGNSVGATVSIGTADAYDVQLIRGGSTVATVGSGGITLASGMDITLAGSGAYISNPQSTTTSEVFGNAASTDGDRNVVMGNSASITGQSDSVAIGYAAVAGDNSVSIGAETDCTNTGCVSIGFQAVAGFTSTAVGDSSSASHNAAIAIGSGATTGAHESIAFGVGAETTASNQLVIGSDIVPITQMVIGNGVVNSSPVGAVLQASSASGTDVAGADIAIAGGQGTGTGDGGSINFQIADPGSTGASLNALTTVFTLSGVNGSATLQNSTDSTAAFEILSSSGSGSVPVFTVDTTNSYVYIGGTTDNSKTALLILDSEDDGDPSGVNGAMYYDSSSNKFRCYQNSAWVDCIGSGGPGGSSTKVITFVPEYEGGVLTADGSNNNGTMVSDYVDGLSSGAGYKHNYYEWSTSQATDQDYDIVINHQLPSDFNAGTEFDTNSWKVWTYVDSNANSAITMTVYDNDGTACANGVSIEGGGTGWTQVTLTDFDTNGSCDFTANSVITIRIKVTSKTPSSNKVRVGEIQYSYTN